MHTLIFVLRLVLSWATYIFALVLLLLAIAFFDWAHAADNFLFVAFVFSIGYLINPYE